MSFVPRAAEPPARGRQARPPGPPALGPPAEWQPARKMMGPGDSDSESPGPAGFTVKVEITVTPAVIASDPGPGLGWYSDHDWHCQSQCGPPAGPPGRAGKLDGAISESASRHSSYGTSNY